MPARRTLKRCARGTPPRRIPISATSLLVSFLSAISCAMRVRARLRAGGLRMRVDSGMHSLATSQDGVKGAQLPVLVTGGLPALTPFGAMFDDPISQGPLKSDVATRFFGFDPLVFE